MAAGQPLTLTRTSYFGVRPGLIFAYRAFYAFDWPLGWAAMTPLLPLQPINRPCARRGRRPGCPGRRGGRCATLPEREARRLPAPPSPRVHRDRDRAVRAPCAGADPSRLAPRLQLLGSRGAWYLIRPSEGQERRTESIGLGPKSRSQDLS